MDGTSILLYVFVLCLLARFIPGISGKYKENRIAYFGFSLCLGLCAANLFSTVQAACNNASGNIALLFRLPVCIIGPVAALHAMGYLHGHAKGWHCAAFWAFYNAMLACMMWVTASPGLDWNIIAPYGDFIHFVNFLTAWELMGITSFALVAFEHRSHLTMKAAWNYIIACHAGGALLIVMYGAACRAAGLTASPFAFAAVILGVLAFGLKIGLPMLHTWLPEAHPAAPAPVSAVMSGAMIALGFFGIFRIVPLNAECGTLMAWILTACGTLVIVPAVIMALAQNNLKRLLAYSSVENMGITALGFGLGMFGMIRGDKMMAFAGIAGAVLHILNHAFLKGTLFLAAGSVLRATGILDLDKMGGLMKRMPYTGKMFCLSAISLSGLPPFNGFIGEFLVYFTAFRGVISNTGDISGTALRVLCIIAILALALTGGLAAAAYSRAIGAAFLGEPRTEQAAKAAESPLCMRLALMLLSVLSLVMIFASPWLCRHFIPGIISAMQFPTIPDAEIIEEISGMLDMISIFSGGIILITVLFCLVRRMLPRGAKTPVKPTWDCGYARPDARMEYTGTALAQPIMDYFAPLIKLSRKRKKPDGLFPESASVELETDDMANTGLWRPLRKLFWKAADAIHRLQSGYIHIYVLAMLVALMAMLIWGFLFNSPVSPEAVLKEGMK